VKYRRSPQFNRDWRALSADERAKVRRWLAEVMLPATEARAQSGPQYVWPASLRFEQLGGTNGIFAVTWSFAGPDGRATFHFEQTEDGLCLVWRRIGHHGIYRAP
jgi:hypothetical protein